MPKEDWRGKVGNIVIGVVVVVLAIVIYMVVSGQWGTKRFRGIEKFRGDRQEQIDRFEQYTYVITSSEHQST
jgi:hypothetical protein